MPVTKPKLSIIIPALNDRIELEASIEALRIAGRQSSLPLEIIVVDGGSGDGTLEWADAQKDLIVRSSIPGRANQMNAGADAASGDWLLFLHADSHVNEDLLKGLEDYLDGSCDVVYSFELRFRGEAPAFRKMERGVAWRCRKFSLPYGDQGLCVHRELFHRMKGFQPGAYAEDLDFVLRLRSHGRIVMLPYAVHTSTRQWERQGLIEGTAHNLGRLATGIALHYLRGDWLKNNE